MDNNIKTPYRESDKNMKAEHYGPLTTTGRSNNAPYKHNQGNGMNI